MFPAYFPVTCHTNFVRKGSTFVAIKGQHQDGIDFIGTAVDLGATSIVVQHDAVLSYELKQKINNAGVELQYVEDARKSLAFLSIQALGNPASRLKIIGITGTKGKTTTAFLVEHILRTGGYKTSLISSVTNRIGAIVLEKNLTTPQPDYLQVFFAECVRLGVEWVVMEVSAQALSLHRVLGIQFDSVIFTNFSQDHAEFYHSQEAYFKAKCLLFDQVKKNGSCILNADDSSFHLILKYVENKFAYISTSFMQQNGNALVNILKNSLYQGLSIKIQNRDKEIFIDSPHLIGIFNAYNCAMAALCALYLGVSDVIVSDAFKTFDAVPGRMYRHVLRNGALGVIDYAHTPSSFTSVLLTLRQMTEHLIVVFGAGGNRDTIKRPIMGSIAALYADMIILTTDNPRSERAEDIVQDILAGINTQAISKVEIELDREYAIKKAYQASHSKSIIALLGKGPDEYQEVDGVKIPFSESDILRLLD